MLTSWSPSNFLTEQLINSKVNYLLTWSLQLVYPRRLTCWSGGDITVQLCPTGQMHAKRWSSTAHFSSCWASIFHSQKYLWFTTGVCLTRLYWNSRNASIQQAKITPNITCHCTCVCVRIRLFFGTSYNYWYMKGANEVNKQYFQQAVPLCLLKALYYAGICSYAACIVLCSKLCWHNSPRSRSGWLLARGTLSQSSVLPWWIRMILVMNYLALVTLLHNIYSRTVLVVQLNIQPLSLHTNNLNFCSCTVSTPFVCVCVCVCVCMCVCVCVTLTVWVSLIFDQLSGFCCSLRV